MLAIHRTFSKVRNKEFNTDWRPITDSLRRPATQLDSVIGHRRRVYAAGDCTGNNNLLLLPAHRLSLSIFSEIGARNLRVRDGPCPGSTDLISLLDGVHSELRRAGD